MFLYISVASAGLTAVVIFTPVLASTLSFVSYLPDYDLSPTHQDRHMQITYALSGHDLNVATIFTSLQYFDVSLLSIMLSSQYIST